MKICVVVPSKGSLVQAGVRIRYMRIEAFVRAAGHEFRLAALDDILIGAPPEDDVFLLSKCYDVRSLILAIRLGATGRQIGIDLFDDYFSQTRDSRTRRFSVWLADIVPSIDFILCSTPAMAQVARTLAPSLPVHVMNDPAPAFDADRLRESLRRRLDDARSTGLLKACWFGIGDNAQFPVGLADLTAFADELARLGRRRFKVQLAIRTNVRALTGNTLAKLRRLPMPYSLDEWSVDSEVALLEDSLVSFLPVNGQNFSIVKSLNRALSALTHGAQVLSPGYDLYRPLAPFIYDDPAALLADLDRGEALLRPETVDRLSTLVAGIGSAEGESRNLIEFLQSLPQTPQATSPDAARFRIAIVHGARTIEDIGHFAHKFNILTVVSPYCEKAPPSDVVFRFRRNAPELSMAVADTLWPYLPALEVARLGPSIEIEGKVYRLMAADMDKDLAISQAEGRSGALNPVAVMASYTAVMTRIEGVLARLFPGIHCLISERSVYPYKAPRADSTRRSISTDA